MTTADHQLRSRFPRSESPRPADPAKIEDLKRRAYAAGFAVVDLGALDREEPGLGMRVRDYVTRTLRGSL